MDSPRQNPNKVRLQKYLAACGLGSRRACETLIAAGRVRINGQRITEQGRQIDPRTDVVRVDEAAPRPEQKTYLLFNKPRDVLCTCRDPRNRRTFQRFVSVPAARLFPVGRLDRNSEGLLILTNDGELAQTLAHPRHQVDRTYLVWIDQILTAAETQRLLTGVVSDGEKLAAVAVERAPGAADEVCYRVVLRTGRNRQIVRMFAVLGYTVRRLRRVAFGPLRLHGLRLGAWRRLTDGELEALKQAAAGPV